MEDAALALRIASGVIIGILLSSLLIFVFSRIRTVENVKADKLVMEDTNEFNMKYIAYDKQMMYGTDLISAIGMAINNNEICNLQRSFNPDGRYVPDDANSIDIVFKLLSPVYSREITYVKDFEFDSTTGEYKVVWNKSGEDTDLVFNSGTLYDLQGTDYDKIVKIAIEGNKTVTQKVTSNKVVETDTSGFNDLKLRVFKCTKIDYNNVGRICSMTFEEINT